MADAETSVDFRLKMPKRTDSALTAEIGRSGLMTAGGYVLEEFLSEVSGLRWRRIVKEMRWNDSVIHSMFFLYELLTRGVEWKIKAGGDDNESQRQAEFLKSCMDDMSQSWADTITEAISFVPWGFSWHEVVYKIRNGERPLQLELDAEGKPKIDPNHEEAATSKYDDGMIGWRKIPIRSQDSLESWVFDDNGGIQAMNQNTVFRRATIPIDKSLLFRMTPHKNNPEGDSLLRHIWRDWFFKQRIQNIEGIGIERDLAGMPVGSCPSEFLDETKATAGQKKIVEDFKNIIVNVRRDEQEGILIPSDCFPNTDIRMFDIKLLSTAGSRQFDTSRIVQRYDQRMLMTLMADFLLLGHEKVGSFALASSKTELFSYGVGATLDIVCDIFNRHAIPKLLKLNGMKSKTQPMLDHGDVESVDVGELADFVSKTSNTIPLNDDQKRWVLRQGGVPVDENQPIPQPPAPAPPPGGAGQGERGSSAKPSEPPPTE